MCVFLLPLLVDTVDVVEIWESRLWLSASSSAIAMTLPLAGCGEGAFAPEITDKLPSGRRDPWCGMREGVASFE